MCCNFASLAKGLDLSSGPSCGCKVTVEGCFFVSAVSEIFKARTIFLERNCKRWFLPWPCFQSFRQGYSGTVKLLD